MAKRTVLKRSGGKSGASGRDRNVYYERAVQNVEAEIDFVDETYRALRGRNARRLREDFCGTGNTSAEWVRRRRTNEAVGVDLDGGQIEWGVRHHLSKLTPGERGRIRLVESNVLTTTERGFDCILAMNFSYWLLPTRADMLRYFTSVRASLNDGGLFFQDIYGGPDAQRVCKERRPLRGFTYEWEQESFDPITGLMTCHITFRFPRGKGAPMKRAFTYTWRLWHLTEIRDILADAGFSKTTVYWEGDDGKGGGDGNFQPTASAETCPAYIAYIVSEK